MATIFERAQQASNMIVGFFVKLSREMRFRTTAMSPSESESDEAEDDDPTMMVAISSDEAEERSVRIMVVPWRTVSSCSSD